jgi:hypothetical protein
LISTIFPVFVPLLVAAMNLLMLRSRGAAPRLPQATAL